MKSLFLTLITCCLLLAIGPASAAPSVAAPPMVPVYRDLVRHYDSNDGLPQNSITAIQQGRFGYLWVGTYGGLVRFDGLDFEVFRSRARQGPGSDRILSLAVDAQGRLWIGTEDAGLTVRTLDGKFIRLPACQQRCRIFDIHAIGNDIVALADHAVLVFRNGALREEVLGMPSTVYSSAVDARGQLYFFAGDGFWHFDGQRVTRLPDDPQRKGFQSPLSVIGGDIHAVFKGELLRWDGTRWRPHPLPGIAKDTINVFQDAQGGYWATDGRARMYRVDEQGEREKNPDVVLPGVITRKYVDREGNFWAGTDGSGLYQVRRSRVALLKLGLFDTPGGAMVGDRQGGLWMAPSCSGVVRLSATGEVNRLQREEGGHDGCVWSMALAPDGRLWLGTTEGALRYLDVRSGKSRAFKNWESRRMIQVIHQTPEGEFWVAVGDRTYRGRVAASGALPEDLQPVSQFDGIKWIRIQPAQAGGVWLVGDAGVWRWQNGRVVQKIGVSEGLSSRFARSLREEKDGTLLIGTYGGGLNVWRDGRWSLYTESQGMQDDVVSCILEDRLGRLWFSGNRGLSYLSVQERAHIGRSARIATVGVGSEDGLNPAETNGSVDPACHTDAQGRLWFALISGVAVVDPASLTASNVPLSPPTITGIRLETKEIEPVNGVLQIPADGRDLDISFAAPALSEPQRRKFRFRWADAAQWTELGKRTSVFLPLVPFGKSELQISVAHGDGAWSEPTRINIAHPRPWYLRPGGIALGALSLILLTLFARRVVARYLMKRTERVAEPLRHRAEELEQSNRLLDVQARRDPLTGLYNRRHFDEVLNALWADQRSRPMTLLLVDVDHFKAYNDHFGHLQGDDCLRTIAKTIEDHIRTNDVAARFGGEEFVLLLPCSDRHTALAMAERLRVLVASLELPQAPQVGRPHVTLSIGCATESRSPGESGDVTALLARADAAMYRAKQAGRDQVSAD